MTLLVAAPTILPLESIVPANVDTPETFNLWNVGVSDIVIVAMPLGCTSAEARMFTPRKSSCVILPAVPTVAPSSLTVKPFRIVLTADAPWRFNQSQPPEPLATGTYPLAPKLDPLVLIPTACKLGVAKTFVLALNVRPLLVAALTIVPVVRLVRTNLSVPLAAESDAPVLVKLAPSPQN